MSGFQLNDEQDLAARTLRGPVSIAAGAGSGKTRVLAERGANAVVPGSATDWDAVRLDQLLAITFTDKAAGELAERVRHTLRTRGCQSLATDVDSAWISTIHGMCARILRTSALEAGIDPSFTVLDTMDAASMREAAFDEAAAELLRGANGAAGLLAEYPYDQVASAVQALSEELKRRGMQATDLRMRPGAPVVDLCSEALMLFRDSVLQLGSCGATDDVAEPHLNACSATVSRLESLCELDASEGERIALLWRILAEHVVPTRYKGMKELRQSIIERRKMLLAATVSSATGDYCKELVALTDRYSTLFADRKRAAGALDFDDLQGAVLDLFARRPDVAAAWGSRFQLTMVDEFQDTDQQQLGIVRAIAGANLCTVGDAMQSIYRFRGADIDVYREHNERMGSLGAVSVELSSNYRSHPDILEFVNHVFGRLAPEGLVLLRPGRSEPDAAVVRDAARVELFVASRGERSAVVRPAIAQRIAQRIEEVHRGSGVPLHDIVVLLRSYSHAEVYAQAIRDAGLDAVVIGGDRFLDLPEVAVMHALCRLLGNRSDEEALGVVLASPLCGMSDTGLMSLRLHADDTRSGLADALVWAELGDADSMRRDLLLETLDLATALVGVRPLGEILLRVFERSGWDVLCLSRRSVGLQTYATVLKLCRMADAFEAGKGTGPAAFASFLEDKRRYGDHESPAAVVGEGAQAVRIMSIHASKGLEFPVVVVPELDASAPSDKGIARWQLKPTARIAMQLPPAWGKDGRRSEWFDEISKANKAAEDEEYLRVFYVAFTRARELLILAGTDVAATNNSMMRVVLDAVATPADGEAGMPVEVNTQHVAVEVAEEAAPIALPVMTADAHSVRRWIDMIRQPVPEATTSVTPPTRLSYSGIAAYKSCARRFRATHLLKLLPNARPGRGVSAAQFGSAVHAAFELSVDPTDTAAVERIARYHRLDAEATSRLVEALRNYGDSDVAELERTWGGTIRREVPFAVRIGADPGANFILDGSIDLYARNGSRGLIIDFKTGSSGDEAELRGRYELQARCYALAAIRDGSVDVTVLFVRPEVRLDSGIQRVGYRFAGTDAADIERDLLDWYGGMAADLYPAREARDRLTCDGCPVSSDCPAPPD